MDLSSVHGPIRPPRRRQPQDDISALGNNNNANQLGHLGEDTLTPVDPSDNAADQPPTNGSYTTEPEALASERIQILGLHTSNPIISYCNQLFSCTWADQIGTELIFAHPDAHTNLDNTDHQSLPSLMQGPSFELLAANSVKILGQKANITSSSNPGVPGDVQPAGARDNLATAVPADDAQALSMSTNLPRRGLQTSHQANFLARLQAIKTQRGETDTVRTTFSTKRTVTVADRLGAWARTEAQLAEIHALNDRAHKGDTAAIAALEQMMRDIIQQQHQQQSEPQLQSSQQQDLEQPEPQDTMPIDPQLM